MSSRSRLGPLLITSMVAGRFLLLCRDNEPGSNASRNNCDMHADLDSAVDFCSTSLFQH